MSILTTFNNTGINYNLMPGSIIEPIVTVYNALGSISNSINLQNFNAIVKDKP